MAAMIGWCSSTAAQSGPVLDRQIDKQLGAAYAAMINFAENPDIATAHYYIEHPGDKDAILRVTRLGTEHEFHFENHDWVPFIQLHVPYQTFSASFDLDADGQIESKWSAVGATLISGIGFPVTTNLSVKPALACGYVRLWNDGDYSGPIAVVEPVLDGILFDWSSDAWLVGASIGLDYERMFSDEEINLYAGASHNLIETFQSTRGSVEFSSYVTTLRLSGEWVHPTALRIRSAPLSIVTMLGGTSFAGPYRDELGFAYFVDAGLAFELDLSDREWLISRLRLGAKGIVGEDVTGWSAIISWKF